MFRAFVPVAVILSLFMTNAGCAKAGDSSVRVPRIADSAQDSAWSEPVSDFRDVVSGSPAASKTECRFAHTGSSLLARCTAFQDPSSTSSGMLSATSQKGDYVAIAVSVGNPAKPTQYIFYTNPKGNKFVMGTAPSMPAAWDASVTTTPASWTATIAIPYQSIGASGGLSSLHACVLRNMPEAGGFAVWPYVKGAQPMSVASEALLTGLDVR